MPVDKTVDNSVDKKSEKFRFSSKIASKKSEKFRLLSANFSLFLCYYYLIFKAFKYVKQQQQFFNRQNRKNSDFLFENFLFREKVIPSLRFSEHLSRERCEDPRPPAPSGRAVGGETFYPSSRFTLAKKQMPTETRQTVFSLVRSARMSCSVKGFRNALVVCPALRFTRRIKKLVAKVSARPFLRGVRSAWMPSSVLSCRQLWEPGISGLKYCNKPTYEKLFSLAEAARNLPISGLIASFDALRALIRAKTPRNSPADAPPSLARARARRKKGENGASAPAFFGAPLRLNNRLQKGLTA
jgi:hypothetical protein